VRPQRLRPDALHRLYRRGGLSGEAWRAAQEIRQVGEGLSTALMARPGRLGAPSGRQARGPVDRPIDRLPPALQRALRGHYRQWTDEMSRILVSRSPRISLLSLSLAIVLYGATFTDLEARLGLRRGHGIVRGWLACALQRYAALADGLDNGRRGRL
jgi:hypothetical protein